MVFPVCVFYYPIGASGIDSGRIDFKPGANPSTTPFFEGGLHLKVGMYSGPEIHGVSPVRSQYGFFGPVPRYFPGNLQKPETRPIFAITKMSARESHFLAVEVVRWAPNLHMYNSTHQDLSFPGEWRSISYGITPYCVEN